MNAFQRTDHHSHCNTRTTSDRSATYYRTTRATTTATETIANTTTSTRRPDPSTHRPHSTAVPSLPTGLAFFSWRTKIAPQYRTPPFLCSEQRMFSKELNKNDVGVAPRCLRTPHRACRRLPAVDGVCQLFPRFRCVLPTVVTMRGSSARTGR